MAEEDQLRALAREIGLPDDDPAVLQRLRAIRREATDSPGSRPADARLNRQKEPPTRKPQRGPSPPGSWAGVWGAIWIVVGIFTLWASGSCGDKVARGESCSGYPEFAHNSHWLIWAIIIVGGVGALLLYWGQTRATSHPCPRCGERAPNGFMRCGRCGFDFQRRPCPRCGEDVEKGVLDCPHCGFDFRTIGAPLEGGEGSLADGS